MRQQTYWPVAATLARTLAAALHLSLRNFLAFAWAGLQGIVSPLTLTRPTTVNDALDVFSPQAQSSRIRFAKCRVVDSEFDLRSNALPIHFSVSKHFFSQIEKATRVKEDRVDNGKLKAVIEGDPEVIIRVGFETPWRVQFTRSLQRPMMDGFDCQKWHYRSPRKES